MSDIGDAIGSMVSGAAIARAIEPGASGKRPVGVDAGEGDCLNCGTKLIGDHCHSCGQSAHIHRTFGAFMHDLLHGALHFEGKTWRTLPMLAFRPGKLTRRYIDGERARFVSPMALFLFSVFLMFAVFQISGLTVPGDIAANDEVKAGIENTRGLVAGELEIQQEKLAQLEETSPAYTKKATDVAELEEALRAIDAGDSFSFKPENGPEMKMSFNRTGWPRLDAGIKKARENPGLLLYKIQANSYKFSWLLVPLSLPFVWLIFLWKSRFGLYDHAVFVTYSIAFMSLLFIVLTVLGGLGVGAQWLIMAAGLIAPFHIYKQLKHAYGLSRFSALWRTAIVLAFIAIVIALFLWSLIMLGLLG
ncbi:DUF3667 domain-containing protein [Altererythrobacter aquiaggeris]|uniref:DUF3667 domain-containing protein n=1 Tax=Aestuarierythrobacter aquiaggeris TaxID=1898396 RepID=UPI003017EC52